MVTCVCLVGDVFFTDFTMVNQHFSPAFGELFCHLFANHRTSNSEAGCRVFLLPPGVSCIFLLQEHKFQSLVSM